MVPLWIARAKLVNRAVLLVFLTGCGIVTSTRGPQPVGVGSGAVPVAPTGLQLGYTWQSGSGNLFPILGVSGAAHYGSGILPGNTKVVTAAAITSSSSSWALVLQGDGTLHEWESPNSTTTTLADRLAPDSTIVFSPSGTFAAIFSASTQSVVEIGGLPAKPQLTIIPLPSGALPRDSAISDSGTILLGVKSPVDKSINLGVLSATRSYSTIGPMQAWGGAGFLPGTTTDAAIIADSGTAQLTYVANPDGVSPTVSVLPRASILGRPAGVGVSLDGQWVYVVDTDKPQIVRMSIAHSESAAIAIPCACKPEQMIPLTSDGIFLVMSNATGKPDWILDTRTAQPRTFFVPAIARDASGQVAAATTNQTDRAAR